MSVAVIAHLRSRLNWRALAIMVSATAMAFGMQYLGVAFALQDMMQTTIDTAVPGLSRPYAFMLFAAFDAGQYLVPLGWVVYLLVPLDAFKTSLFGAVVAGGMAASMALGLPAMLFGFWLGSL